MEVASLGYQTDLTLLRLSGAQVEDRGDHLVVRSPYNPGHWWGNFLLLDQVPEPEASQSWLDRFTAAFPEAEHVALGFDKTHGTIADLNWFSRKGFIAEAQMVMTASKVHQPARRNTYAVYRKVCSDADWRQSVTLRLRCNEGAYEPRAYRRYVIARVQTYRNLVEAGHGGWFGAFIQDRLVSQMGLFLVSPGLARFQAVETDPDYRRRGLAASLVHHVSQYGLAELAARTLVIVADPNYFAINLYLTVGFDPTETQLQVECRPPSVSP
jgi:GNAT superfamily N-acetyltransferase